jgi:hypothetical protein
MWLRQTANYTLLDAKWATGIDNVGLAEDFRNCTFSFATDGWGDANLTIKFQWSIQVDKPNFAAAQSVTNMWDYIEVIDIEDNTAIDWDTWIAVSGADAYRQFEANINGLRWVCARVTARTAWEVTVKAYLFSND